MGVSAGIAIATTVGGMVVGNQQKQKAKGEAGQAERDAAAAQAAVDLKLKQQHDDTIRQESQAGAVARKQMMNDGASSTPKPLGAAPITPPALTPLTPVSKGAKTLLGQ